MTITQNDILLIGINSKYIHPANGIYQLVANCDYNITFKEFTIKDNIESIVSYINNFNPKYVGFSVYIWNVNIVSTLINKLSCNIILGGPEASFKIDYFFKYPNVLYIIQGEGEESFNMLCHHLIEGSNISFIPNLYYKDTNIKYTFKSLPNLNTIVHNYDFMKDYTNRICYVESSRGCYFNCSYCLASTEKPVRFFNMDEIKNNLLFLLNKNAKTIKFLDRSFNIKESYMIEILEFIKKHDNNISTFQFEIVGDSLSQKAKNLLNTMRYKSIRLEIGIQTTNPKTTKAILRKQDFNKLRQNILNIKDNVIIHTDLIAGLPYEDLNSFKKSFNETFMLLTEELQLGFLKELKGTYISNTKDIHGYVFSENSPYEVISNNYISKEELDIIRYVELGVDKIYNKNLYPRLIKYLFLDLKLDPFKIFLSIGKNITHQMDLTDISQSLYCTLKKDIKDDKYLLFLIKQDYLSRNNIKPKIWWEQEISRNERKLVIEEFVKRNTELTCDLLYRYSRIEKYNNIYYLILYQPKSEYFMEVHNGFN